MTISISKKSFCIKGILNTIIMELVKILCFNKKVNKNI